MSSNQPQNATNHTENFLVVGDEQVGKSCFLLRATEGSYTDAYISTIGASHRTLPYDDTQINVFDFKNGQSLAQSYRDTGEKTIILCFDVTDANSFNNLPRWINEIKRINPDASIALVGTKADDEDNRQVPRETVDDFIEKNKNCIRGGILFYKEVSAKENTNCREVLHEAVDILRQRKDAEKKSEVVAEPRLTKEQQLAKKKEENQQKVRNEYRAFIKEHKIGNNLKEEINKAEIKLSNAKRDRDDYMQPLRHLNTQASEIRVSHPPYTLYFHGKSNVFDNSKDAFSFVEEKQKEMCGKSNELENKVKEIEDYITPLQSNLELEVGTELQAWEELEKVYEKKFQDLTSKRDSNKNHISFKGASNFQKISREIDKVNQSIADGSFNIKDAKKSLTEIEKLANASISKRKRTVNVFERIMKESTQVYQDIVNITEDAKKIKDPYTINDAQQEAIDIKNKAPEKPLSLQQKHVQQQNFGEELDKIVDLCKSSNSDSRALNLPLGKLMELTNELEKANPEQSEASRKQAVALFIKVLSIPNTNIAFGETRGMKQLIDDYNQNKLPEAISDDILAILGVQPGELKPEHVKNIENELKLVTVDTVKQCVQSARPSR